eukprot:TRINITY_DN3244_c1_g2_i3.p1 TRINITY_DN3244_c1_g2~~TRINITY_DN3244_c1_g2_i3.p1  ORF type:complete len:668 (-),score=166.30 TRINITY_DN3244_c1_g2_i3:548-2551(-)
MESAGPPKQSTPSSSSYSGGSSSSRIPEDTIIYSIFPDSSLSPPPSSSLESLHLQISSHISQFTSSYIWQHHPFRLSISSHSPKCPCSSSSPSIPHLCGAARFGDNLDDEWFIASLLFDISEKFPSVTARACDADGEFLLIEAAFHLPRWISPSTTPNRVFIRRGALCIVPRSRFPETPSLADALRYLAGKEGEEEARAPEAVQAAIRRRIKGYPEKARLDMHRVRVRVPVCVAKVLREEPCLIALAVEGFYDRDVDSMKYAAKMEKFGGREEEMVRVSVRMSRAMYAQLVQQGFQAPRCYWMPERREGGGRRLEYVEAELGMKIACGMEMMYEHRRREGLEGKGSTWEAYRESLERSGYFECLLPGSMEYRRRMENAMDYYRKSSVFSRTSEMMSAPVRRIDEILALPVSVDEFNDIDLPSSDDDSWLYNGEDELNAAIAERQKEMEAYESKHRRKKSSREQMGTNQTSSPQLDDFDFGGMVKSMQEFVSKVSSYEGAEVPKDRESEEVEVNAEHFIKEMESVLGHFSQEDTSFGQDSKEDYSSSSDMDFDEFEDGNDLSDDPLDEDMDDAFMNSYSNALNEELKQTTLKKSFIRANEHSTNDNEGASNASKDTEEELTPVDVDVNLVKSLLDSVSSQQGLPGPATNLLGLMGFNLPQDTSATKGK